MDIKKAIMDAVNSAYNLRYASLATEKLVEVMLQDYLHKQGKEYESNKMESNVLFDGWLPQGIDDIKGCVAVEIKITRNGHFALNRLYDLIGRIARGGANVDALLLIVIGEVPSHALDRFRERELQLNFKVHIWDIDKLVEIFRQNEELFIRTYTNLSKVMIQDTISSGISRSDDMYKAKKREYVERLHFCAIEGGFVNLFRL